MRFHPRHSMVTLQSRATKGESDVRCRGLDVDHVGRVIQPKARQLGQGGVTNGSLTNLYEAV